MVTETMLHRAKLKLKLKPFATSVKRASGLMIKPSDKLLNSLADEDSQLIKELLVELGLQQQPGGYWERKQ